MYQGLVKLVSFMGRFQMYISIVDCFCFFLTLMNSIVEGEVFLFPIFPAADIDLQKGVIF